jgi:hypothetical protein
MSEFEEELRSALRRQEPPGGFADRVMARTRPKPKSTPRRANWVAAAMAACLLLGLGGFEYRQYEGRKARRELVLALEIAGSKLSMAQARVSQLSQRTIHE